MEEPEYEFTFDVFIEFIDNDKKLLLTDITGVNYDINVVSFLSDRMKGSKFSKNSLVIPISRIKQIKTSIVDLKVL